MPCAAAVTACACGSECSGASRARRFLLSPSAITGSHCLLRLPRSNLATVAQHKSRSDIWLTIHDKVYNVTEYMENHPGGEEVLMDRAGAQQLRSTAASLAVEARPSQP